MPVRDPIRLIAYAMIVLQLAGRAYLTSRGTFSQDEFVVAAQAAAAKLTPDYLLGIFNNHLMPGGMLVAWMVVRLWHLAEAPYMLLITILQLALNIAFYRLLRLVTRPGWGQLVALGVMLLSPLTLESNALWVVALLVLPFELALVLALSAQVKYVHTGRSRHLVSLTAAVLLGLLFTEKGLFIIPTLFLFTGWVLVEGGPIRGLARGLIQHWREWLVLAFVSGGYVGLYLSRPRPPLSTPRSPDEVLTFLRDIVGFTLVPGLAGGGWRWTYAGDGPPLVDRVVATAALSWALALALIVWTSLRRSSARRAWLVLAAYVVMVLGMLVASRMGSPLTALAGLVPRYVSDTAIVAALCLGIALCGVPWEPVPSTPARPHPVLRGAAWAVALACAATAVLTTVQFGQNWPTKVGSAYLANAQADLANTAPTTVFLDWAVPTEVVAGYFFPDNMQSHFFRPLIKPPVFVTGAENPSTFDASGRIRPVYVDGVSVKPGPDGACGYRVTGGRTARLPVGLDLFDWPWVIRIGYLSSADTTASVRFGHEAYRFPVKRGLHQYIFVLQGKGGTVEIDVGDPSVEFCAPQVTIGRLVPSLL